jgi:hypothetical protein
MYVFAKNNEIAALNENENTYALSQFLPSHWQLNKRRISTNSCPFIGSLKSISVPMINWSLVQLGFRVGHDYDF